MNSMAVMKHWLLKSPLNEMSSIRSAFELTRHPCPNLSQRYFAVKNCSDKWRPRGKLFGWWMLVCVLPDFWIHRVRCGHKKRGFPMSRFASMNVYLSCTDRSSVCAFVFVYVCTCEYVYVCVCQWAWVAVCVARCDVDLCIVVLTCMCSSYCSHLYLGLSKQPCRCYCSRNQIISIYSGNHSATLVMHHIHALLSSSKFVWYHMRCWSSSTSCLLRVIYCEVLLARYSIAMNCRLSCLHR